jgi:hypothetical protein
MVALEKTQRAERSEYKRKEEAKQSTTRPPSPIPTTSPSHLWQRPQKHNHSRTQFFLVGGVVVSIGKRFFLVS